MKRITAKCGEQLCVIRCDEVVLDEDCVFAYRTVDGNVEFCGMWSLGCCDYVYVTEARDE